MNNHPLTRTEQVCDLGVDITRNLDWGVHIARIVSKANRCLWTAIRALGYDAPTNAKRAAYTTLVRPILEYCTTLWNPQAKNLIEAIERIQRRATNFIINNHHRLNPLYKNYKIRLAELNFLPCTYRRELMDITMLIRSLNTDNGFNTADIFNFIVPHEGC